MSKKCTVTNCNRPHYGKGYCSMHYQKWKRYGDPVNIYICMSRVMHIVNAMKYNVRQDTRSNWGELVKEEKFELLLDEGR